MLHDMNSLLPSEEAQKWLHTAELLRQWAESVPATDWTPTVKGTADVYPDDAAKAEARREILLSFAGSTAAEYVKGSTALLREEPLPPLSEPAKYWLRFATLRAGSFCFDHVCSRGDEGSTTMIPYPPLDEKELCAWLYIQWWPQTGLATALMQASSNENLFYSYMVS